jgi:hypothetical protein
VTIGHARARRLDFSAHFLIVCWLEPVASFTFGLLA